ncbi:tyrosine-protein phosphatase [Pediococcus pentosaceus]|uniref:Tyrosine-protein phosphatase n=1 Tax=Pediococcus pentosaceus CGMCC 7049 TaxID=1460385 RepID=A0AAU7NM26_PEDPE|nr:tyrosine-protein phosphatase [Pediococcus pentosaceus]MCE5960224.1 tyrosine-protein phosphatase [Pediococcus pentosaceus]MCG7197045.1 tyrosine-protein phosphatase [Pediococcus pentosaceus]MCI2396556.1 tyrosine-protein phosphatase [Pediococcus pentosaceus]MCS8569606.1 tyrosine-protein phosphatase [Pediococcus pentosaceus]MCT3021494.1 tyrosine-protein phosphatase [Pediococcus pentosaceus]
MTKPRLLPISSGLNFRELGGYTNLDGKTIKWNKLIRSGKLGGLADADIRLLEDYNVKFDVDFRSPEEKSKFPDRVPSGAEYVFAPVFRVDETQSTKQTDELQRKMNSDPTSGLVEMRRVYRDVIRQRHSQKAYRKFFDVLLANSADDSALLFHCTAGKDRTGMGAIFLLSALNVDEDTIRADYLLTNRATKAYQNGVVMDLKLKNKNSAFIQSVKALQSVNISYYNSAMDEIRRLSGSMDNYLRDYLKLTEQDITDLRKIYLE